MRNNKNILKILRKPSQAGSEFTAAAGFDMVVDNVVRIVKQKDQHGNKQYFQTIEEFGQYILSKKNMSCSLETEIQESKIGGNMAIFSNALGNLGIRVHCIGSMGFPEIYRPFHNMSDYCTLHSVCDTVECSALEFDDGKVMMSSMEPLEELSWETMAKRMKEQEIVNHFKNSQLIALLNWSELTRASALFASVFEKCIEGKAQDKNKLVLIDLSDVSRKPEEEVLHILKLTECFSKYRTTIFSMNENECRLIYHALFEHDEEIIEEMSRRISETLRIDYLIIHLRDRSYGYHDGKMALEQGYYTAKPKLSTGGGDNFNAGFVLGILESLSLDDCLYLGNSVAGYYVRTGKSPVPQQLHDFIIVEGGGGEFDRKKG